MGTVLIIAIVYLLWKKGLLSKVFDNGPQGAATFGKQAWDNLYPNGETDRMAPFNANHVARHIHNILYDTGYFNKAWHSVTMQSGQQETWAYLLSLTDTQLRNIVGAYYKIIAKGEPGLSEAIKQNANTDLFGTTTDRLISRLKSLNA